MIIMYIGVVFYSSYSATCRCCNNYKALLRGKLFRETEVNKTLLSVTFLHNNVVATEFLKVYVVIPQNRYTHPAE